MTSIADSRAGRRRLTAAMLCATAMTAPFAVTPAIAQEAASIDSNTIIVTAQRRDEALEDVPMTVTVLSDETLANAGVNSVRDLATVTSGFQLGNAGSISQPAIRGVTTTNAGSYENNVAVFIDGVYQAVPAAVNIDLPNISNIQILKGPQGTLYGRNATGGAVLIGTVEPGEDWEGKAEVTYARFDDKRASGYVAGPLSDGIGLMISGYTRRTDGYYKLMSRSTPGKTVGNTFGLGQDAIRAKLNLDLSSAFRVKLGYGYTRVDDPRGVHFSQIENWTGNPALPGNETNPTKEYETAYNLNPQIDYKQHEFFGVVEFDTGVGTIKSLTARSIGKNSTNYDFGGTYRPDSFAFSKTRDTMWQQSVDWTIDAIDNVDLIIGGTYYNLKSGFDEPNTFALGPASLGAPYPHPSVSEVPLSSYLTFFARDFDRTKEAWAGFFDATFHATDRLSINVGGRYSKETQRVIGIATGLPGQAYNTLDYEALTGTRFKSTYKKFTPRASIRFEVAPRTNIYASYSKGFRGGEWNSSVPNNNPAFWQDVDQETIDAFEVGVKSAGSRLRFEAAAFYYDYKNLQVSFTTTDPASGATIVTLQNAPSAEIYGVEANFDYEVVENLNIRAGATWLHARYGDDFIYSGAGVNPNVVGASINSDPLKTFGNASQDQDLSGLQMARSPNFSAFFGIDYLIPDGDGGLRFNVNAKYTDSYVPTNPSIWGGSLGLLNGTPYADRERQQRTRIGKYALLNASITWTDPGDHFYARVWGNNLTDHKYPLHYNPISSGTYKQMAEPMTYGITLGYKLHPDANYAPPPPPPP
ncbi:MAG: TonB-dependent receptor, partial [Novosphingobium sp.]|nr:TonB-dependent receptor [Novosphingobium sp.]